MDANRQKLTPLQAKEKIKAWCAYSERCQSEVREKLFGYGLNTCETDEILSYLIEENYVDEERYAKQYAGGHFRMKQWGRVKIKYALKAKGISDYCIKKGLREIDEDDYTKVLSKLMVQKWQSVKGNPPAVRWAKTRQFLLQRGFETDLVLAELKKMEKGGRA
jgi:regulatory protein